jgi:hypothetical protein
MGPLGLYERDATFLQAIRNKFILSIKLVDDDKKM